MSSHEERVARNEQLFQVVNRHIEELEERLGQRKTFSILCECSKKHCLDAFDVEPAVYRRVRSNRLLFFLMPGHEDPEVERVVERVVERTPDYLVVEKTGSAADVVRERAR